ncbi:hypothetical protein LUZ61_022631 [Rhynchospora tenuis]|uniref:Uncharacterized protein n=1 Tax=Rhynchospora tenuis TaxID=198213 RepID=A0AAD5W4S1_9POAL|nr:hypothetical protein LUZ61_022631 [Rhynchospora tenuis]
MDRTWTIVGVGGSPRDPSSGILGKRIKLALANSLMHYLPSTLCAKCGERKENPWTDPIVSTPNHRNPENGIPTQHLF